MIQTDNLQLFQPSKATENGHFSIIIGSFKIEPKKFQMPKDFRIAEDLSTDQNVGKKHRKWTTRRSASVTIQNDFVELDVCNERKISASWI